MTDAEWAAMSEWETDLWEMKHLPEKERMHSIEGIVCWLPVAQQDQRRKELLKEVLRFGEPIPTLDSSTAPASTTGDESIVLQVPTELDVVHEGVDNLVVPTPSTCSTICLGGDTSVTWAPLSSPAAMPTSSGSKPNKPTLTSSVVDPPVPTPGPAAAKLNSSTNTHGVVPERCCFHHELAADAPGNLATPTHVPTMVLLDSTPASAPAVTGTIETDIYAVMPSSCLTLGPEDKTIAMIPMLSIFNFTHDLLVESDCSDTVIVPLSELLDGVSVTISAVPTDDTPQDDQAQTPGMRDVFSILLKNSLSLIFVEVYPGSAEKMQHLVMLEKLMPPLSMELHLLVLVVMRKEAVFWAIFQAAGCYTIPLLPWDPGALLYGIRIIFQVELGQKWMVSLMEQQPWPSSRIFSLVPIVLRITSENFHRTLMLERLIREGALNLQRFGRLHERQVFCSLHLHSCELPWQYFSCKEFQSESFPWCIAWLLVKLYWAISESGRIAIVTLGGWSFWRYPVPLNLVVYWEYPALNIYSMLIIVEHLLKSGLVADTLLLLIPWLQVPYLVVPGYIICSFSAFLANLDGQAEVQHILQGHPHYYELMQGSLYHSLLQSELTPWTSGFATESSIRFLDEIHSSIPLVKLHDLMMEMVDLQPWPSWELFSCIATGYSLDAVFAKVRTLTVLHAGKFYWLLGLHTSCDQFAFEGSTVFHSHYFKWNIPWYVLALHCNSSSNRLRMQRVGDLWKFHAGFLFSWNISITIDKCISDRADFCLDYHFSHLSWDPGGCTQHRLEGKPKFKEGGLSATSSTLISWASQCAASLGPGLAEDRSNYYKYKGGGQNRLGLEPDSKAASSEGLRWLGDRLLFLFFLKFCDPNPPCN